MQKLEKERSRDGWYISVRDMLLEKGCRLRIAQNCTSSTFSPNNEYWKRSWAKNYLKKGTGWAGILASAIARAKKVIVSNSWEIARVAYFGQITIIRSGRTRKLYKECCREVRDISVHDKLLEKGCCH